MKKEAIYKKILLLFIITFPIFDMFIFYNSITTLVRVIIIFLFLIYLLFNCKGAQKNFKWLFLYYVGVLIYALFHHYNALAFNSLVPGNFNYQMIKELAYILKMITPITFIYVLYFSNITKKEYFNVIKWLILIIAGSIVITNLLTFSLGSYSDKLIKGNIFTWFFNNNLTYAELASNAFFRYGNQTSMIVILLLPVLFYKYTIDKKRENIWLLFLLCLSMLILGTRVASVGGIIILALLSISYFIICLINKTKINKKIIVNSSLMVVMMVVIFPFSPCMMRIKETKRVIEQDISYSVAYNGNAKIDKLEYIKNNFKKKLIPAHFVLTAYPYQYDVDFWYYILEQPIEKRIDYRFLEIEMINRVIDINNNKYDKWLGITNNRIQNIFNIEKDITLQYYAFGIIGVLLFLSFYFIIDIILFIKLIKTRDLKYFIGLMIGILLLGCSYMSGNLLNHLTITLPFCFLITNFIVKEHI